MTVCGTECSVVYHTTKPMRSTEVARLFNLLKTVAETTVNGLRSLFISVSDGEMETLRLLCEGKTNAEIAAKLSVAESSVRTYINRMLEKTGYTNRNRLMIAAVGKRMVVPGCWLEEREES